MPEATYGYNDKILRVNLDNGECTAEEIPAETLRKYVGGAPLGAKYLYGEVPRGVEWNDSRNRLILASGPLGGLAIPGSGTFSVITKGPMTGGAACTQASGFFGAYLRLSGFDAVIIQGVAQKLTYLYIHDGTAELKDASALAGKDTWDTVDLIHEELGDDDGDLSIASIGPAGENLVRFAGILGDKGHAAMHNGVGAVMGSKRLKAIAVRDGATGFPLKDGKTLLSLSETLSHKIRNSPYAEYGIYRWGTLNDVVSGTLSRGGWLPVKNYTTNIFAIDRASLDKFGGPYIRTAYEAKRNPCFGCFMHHCHLMKIPSGPYAGRFIEEPEYECMAAWGPVTGQTDARATLMLSNEIDRLGMDTNEGGWLIGLVMECYEKGIITKKDTDGLEMTWGNAEATRLMLRKVAFRDGFGRILAEGTMRAARAIGNKAPEFAIHTMKGNTPRGHDHRAIWPELFDTCVSNTGTLETGRGVSRGEDPFSPVDVPTSNARLKGLMLFDDSLGSCRFATGGATELLIQMLNAVTGWKMNTQEAIMVGRRTVNLLRVFNIKHGISPDLDRPSPRYGSAPVDGPLKGRSIMPLWNQMLSVYYERMGWDKSGKPLPTTLRLLGLEDIIKDL